MIERIEAVALASAALVGPAVGRVAVVHANSIPNLVNEIVADTASTVEGGLITHLGNKIIALQVSPSGDFASIDVNKIDGNKIGSEHSTTLLDVEFDRAPESDKWQVYNVVGTNTLQRVTSPKEINQEIHKAQVVLDHISVPKP